MLHHFYVSWAIIETMYDDFNKCEIIQALSPRNYLNHKKKWNQSDLICDLGSCYSITKFKIIY